MSMLESLQQAITRVQGLPSHATYKDKLTNTFAVVVESDAPRSTSGTDFIQTIKLVDESCPEGVQLCVFAKQADTMPRAQLGDVMELKDVVVQFWKDRPQLFAKMSQPHSFGFSLYRCTAGSHQQTFTGVQPLQRYNTSLHSRHAAERLPQLQALHPQAVGGAAATDSGSIYMRRIKDLAAPEDPEQRPPCVDMRLRVLAVDESDSSEEVIMYGWDATDAKPVPASLQLLPSCWKNTELKVDRPHRHVMPLVPGPGIRVLSDLPPIGTALPVIIEPGAMPSTGLPQVGDWVKIKVVGVAAVQGQWQVVFGKPSRLTQSQPSQGFEALYQTRLANQDSCEWPQDLSKIITQCNIPALPRSTIRQVLTLTAQQQPGPFKVQCRLLGHLPQDLQQWCKVRPQQNASQPVWEWAAHLWLEDATGELRALLLGHEGTKLLGIDSQHLSSSTGALQQLQARLQQLTSVDEGGGVWMEVAFTPLYPAQQQQEEAPLQLSLLQLTPGLQQQQQVQQGLEQNDPGGPQSQQVQHKQNQMPPSEHPAETGLQQHEQDLQAQVASDSPQCATQEQQQGLQQLQHQQPRNAAVHAAQPVFVLHDAVLLEAMQHHQYWLVAGGEGQQGSPTQQPDSPRLPLLHSSPPRKRRRDSTGCRLGL